MRRSIRRALASAGLLCSLSLCFVLAAPAAVAQQVDARSGAGLADQRAAHLRRGVNLSGWFSQFADGRTLTHEQFVTAVTPADLALIRAMGFDHVRLCVDPQPMFHALQADRIASPYLASLDAAVNMIMAHDLAVEIDIQAQDDFKKRLASDDAFVEQFADFWRALATHFSALDPDRVFFEVLNEPELRDPYRWYGIESKLVTAIRDGAPRHTLVVTGAHWSDDDDLLFLEPLRDPNLLYAFHFYDPHIFTHQGATWSENYWHFLKGVPYPSNPEGAQRAAALVPDAVHRLAVVRYGVSQWNAARIDADIAQVVVWAKKWHVPVVCNEFGVYREGADPADRAAWIADVRAALDKYGIGWTMWDYNGGFGVVTKESGRSVPDETTLRALGLAMPPASIVPPAVSAQPVAAK
jgi:endoglucanase